MSISTKKAATEKAMPSSRIRGAAYRYGVAVVSFACALGVGLLARRYGIGHQFAMLLFGIAFAGWNCGLGPAVVAALLSSLAYDYFITPPIYEIGFNRYDLIDFALFSSFAFLISRFRDVRWRTEARLRASEQKYRELIPVIGADPLPYGIKANLPSIEALITYAVQQKLMPKQLSVEELFVDPEAA